MSSTRLEAAAQPNDTSPLLGRPPEANPKSGSHAVIRRRLKKLAKWTAQGLVGGVTALQNAANAGAAPADIDPSQMSAAWFNSLTPELKAFVLINAFSSEGVNAILNVLFLETAYGILVNLWSRQKNNLKEKVIVLAELLFSLDSAITLAAIAEDSFIFLPDDLNAIPATISGLTNFASRVTGIDNAATRARNFFDDDATLQRKLHKALSHLENKADAKALFDTQRNLLNTQMETDAILDSEYNYKTLLANFLNQLIQSSSTESFQKRSWGSKVLSGSGFAFDTLFAAYIGICTFVTFMQKGYQGKKDIWDLCTGNEASSSASANMSSDEPSYLMRMAMAALGAPSGITSGALYFTRALDFRCMLYDMGEHMVIRGKYHFDNSNYISLGLLFMAVVLLGGANYFSSSSGFNMAEKIVEDPKTAIIPMEKGSVAADFYTYGNQLGVGAVNGDSSFRKLYLKAPTRPDRTLTYEMFLREIQNQTKILITDGSRDAARELVKLYDSRQNQEPEPTAHVPGSLARGLFQDPERGPAEQARLEQGATNSGIDSRTINTPKMGGNSNSN